MRKDVQSGTRNLYWVGLRRFRARPNRPRSLGRVGTPRVSDACQDPGICSCDRRRESLPDVYAPSSLHCITVNGPTSSSAITVLASVFGGFSRTPRTPACAGLVDQARRRRDPLCSQRRLGGKSRWPGRAKFSERGGRNLVFFKTWRRRTLRKKYRGFVNLALMVSAVQRIMYIERCADFPSNSPQMERCRGTPGDFLALEEIPQSLGMQAKNRRREKAEARRIVACECHFVPSARGMQTCRCRSETTFARRFPSAHHGRISTASGPLRWCRN